MLPVEFFIPSPLPPFSYRSLEGTNISPKIIGKIVSCHRLPPTLPNSSCSLFPQPLPAFTLPYQKCILPEVFPYLSAAILVWWTLEEVQKSASLTLRLSPSALYVPRVVASVGEPGGVTECHQRSEARPPELAMRPSPARPVLYQACHKAQIKGLTSSMQAGSRYILCSEFSPVPASKNATSVMLTMHLLSE